MLCSILFIHNDKHFLLIGVFRSHTNEYGKENIWVMAIKPNFTLTTKKFFRCFYVVFALRCWRLTVLKAVGKR